MKTVLEMGDGRGFPGDSMIKNQPANEGDVDSIPRLGRSLPLQSPCLGNPMGREAWRAIQSMGFQRVGHNFQLDSNNDGHTAK